MNSFQKKTMKIRCPKSHKLHLIFKTDFAGKDEIVYECPDCGESHRVPKREDFSQAAARIVKEATEDR
jgi:peptide subunit release factor 1 (eRF1)